MGKSINEIYNQLLQNVENNKQAMESIKFLEKDIQTTILPTCFINTIFLYATLQMQRC